MMDKKEVVLKVENVTKIFKNSKRKYIGLNNISFEVFKNEIFGLVGESGCGKTTTGRVIIKLYDIDYGNIYFNNRLINKGFNEKDYHKYKKDIKKTESKIQMIFQDPVASLNPRMTIREIIAEGLIIQKKYSKEYIENKVIEVANLVGLSIDHLNRYPHEFSGGQKQRIGIARAVIMEPDLIIADEAVSALDVSIEAQILNLIIDLKNKLGVTFIFISHDLNVIRYLSDRIAVMKDGEILEIKETENLFNNPSNNYTKELLSHINN